MALLALSLTALRLWKNNDLANSSSDDGTGTVVESRRSGVEEVDSTPLSSQKVFIDEMYFECDEIIEMLSSIRCRAFRRGAVLTGDVADLDVIIQVCSFGDGTDNSELYVKVPQVPLLSHVEFSRYRKKL